jgi:23S rRNA pseudouridine1911/1915/1917 synthase
LHVPVVHQIEHVFDVLFKNENAMTETLTFTVPEEQAGNRLDRFIGTMVSDISRTRIQTFIDSGQVFVNNRPARSGMKVSSGDIITLMDFSIVTASPLPQPESIPLQVVYEDSDLLVIDKPSGMVVHPAAGHSGGTLVNALLGYTDELDTTDPTRPGIVHRLDRDTSGLLMVARTDASMAKLGEMLRARNITKQYLALVEGIPESAQGAIDAPIGRDPRYRQKMAIVTRGGRESLTLFKVEKTFRNRALLRLTLVTGRTHQIRVHCTAIGHPVVGDLIYGRSNPPMPSRQFLHATYLAFNHPITGAPLSFTSPLPPDLADFLASIE